MLNHIIPPPFFLRQTQSAVGTAFWKRYSNSLYETPVSTAKKNA